MVSFIVTKNVRSSVLHHPHGNLNHYQGTFIYLEHLQIFLSLFFVYLTAAK